MFLFIVAIVLVLIAVGAFVFAIRAKDAVIPGDRFNADRTVSADGIKRVAGLVGVVALGLGLLLTFFTTFYTQDPGEARVLRSFTGEVVGQDLTPGADFKAPWVDLVDFDIRNQMVAFISDGTQNFNGSVPNGPQITSQDSEGVAVNMDVVINYSINPDAVTNIYSNYQSQENFRLRFIEQDVRSVVRDVPNQYTTLEVLTQRAEISSEIQAKLEERWSERGVVIESVSLQEIRYSDEVRASFDQAQQARINVETSEANLAAAEVNAQQRVVEAQAQAEANRLLTESLTDDVLAQRYLDTLEQVGESGNLIVVPEGFNGILNLPSSQ